MEDCHTVMNSVTERDCHTVMKSVTERDCHTVMKSVTERDCHTVMKSVTERDCHTVMTSVTERRNQITTNIDVASPFEIVDLLYRCDKEIFDGWQRSNGLLDKDFLIVLERLTDCVVSILQDAENNAIVVSGCGTSGRLAFMTARSFNAKLRENQTAQCYRYLIAGGDKALFQSQEAFEDDPYIGKDVFQQICEGKKRVLLIGVTCGMSAAYIAGQLDHAMDRAPQCVPVLLGFSPVSLARNVPIENWDKTFLKVAERLEEKSRSNEAFVLTPTIGPEPIAGSSRMKSGTATKLLLEVVLSAAHQRVFDNTNPCEISSLIQAYQHVMESVYSEKEAMAQVLTMAGRSLNAGGHIYYVSSSTLGIVGMVDASECPPTFGADLDDIRGFLDGGYATLNNTEGDLSTFIRIDREYFEVELVPQLTQHDLIIYLNADGAAVVSSKVLSSTASKVVINFTTVTKRPTSNIVTSTTASLTVPLEVTVCLPWHKLTTLLPPATLLECGQFYVEMACKWTCNVISTGAHIIRGKICENIMIDVKVSNNKLFHRAVGIVQNFSRCSVAEAEEALLKSIYKTDSLSPSLLDTPVSVHIQTAAGMDKVVPTALLVATLRCSVAQATAVLSDCPVIRTAILQKLPSDV